MVQPAMNDLYEPLVFRTGLTAKNRLVLAPMTNKQSNDDGSLGEDERRWLLSRAKAGYGIIETCASHVAKDGQGWQGELGIFDDSLLPGLTTLASELRAHGAVSIVQIFHGGLRADAALIGEQPFSASEGQGARAATKEDIARVTQQFVDAADRAKRAGFDGVELHGAHGYLFGQFLSTLDNQRTDEWGGTLENRARLLRDVTRAVRERVGPSFTVGVRISPEDFGQARGIDLDESLQLARWLAEDGIDFLHVSLWRAQLNTRKRPDEHALRLFRAALPDDVRLLTAGSVWTRGEADELLALGADGIALGRSAVVNRDWPTLARDHAWVPVRPPVTVEHLVANDLSPTFAAYMGNWKGFLVGAENATKG
jgi:2,4-dienoyl-CoA reductase-like NADH-dependent reductase (Old Yellow Enzyme family)